MPQAEIAYTIADLLLRLISQRGDAVHLHDGESPVLEIKRSLHKIEGPALKPGDTYALLAIHAPEEDLRAFQSDGLACFYHRVQDSVFQFMAFRESGHVRLEMRKLK